MLTSKQTNKGFNHMKKNIYSSSARGIVTSLFVATLAAGSFSQTALAKDETVEKITKNGKTVYKKKASTAKKAEAKQSKPKVVLYFAPGCMECVDAVQTIFDHDTNFTRKGVEQRVAYKSELIKLTGSAKTPVLFINGKEIRNISPSVIKSELKKAGAKRKPKVKPQVHDENS